MWHLLRQFWKLVNSEPLNPQRMEFSMEATKRILKKYLFKPYPWSIAFIIIVSSMTCSVNKFIYAWAGQFIADDIVEVHLLSRDIPQAAYLDPSRPDENRTFELDQQNIKTSWTFRHDNKPGKTISQKISLLFYVIIILIVTILADHVGMYLITQRIIVVGQKVNYHLRHRLYEKLHSLPMSYLDRNAIGSLMTNLFSDVQAIQISTLQLIRHIPMNIVIMLLGITIMFSIDPRLSLLVALALPMYMICYIWFHRRLQVVHGNLRERQGRLDAHMTNRISNFYLVKAFVRETFEALVFHRKSRKIINETLATAVLGTLFGIICGIISGVCMVMVLWIGGLKVRDGEMTIGTLLLFYGSAGYMFQPVASLTAHVGLFHRLCAVCSKVMRVLDEPIKLSDPISPSELPDQAPEIVFENVTLKYSSNRPAAIDNLNITIPAGKSVCVMGSSGSGKTTLAKLACRIYDPSEGKITFGGLNIKFFRLIELHKFIGYVNQDPIIFDGTIEQNIRYGSWDSQQQQIVSAAQSAQIHDFIMQLPSQYETVTKERGMTLSGGQKQRVNLARTLLYDPKILILDDCTSALDAETEARLVRGFETVLNGRTSILISHRISIATQCDFVLILDNGKAVEFDEPMKLLENSESLFNLLKKQQTKEEKFEVISRQQESNVLQDLPKKDGSKKS